MGFDTFILEPIKDVWLKVVSFGPIVLKLLYASVLVFAGWVFSRFVRDILTRFFTIIHFDKVMTDVGLAGALRLGGIKRKPGELLSCLFYWIVMLGTIIVAVKSLGVTMASSVIDYIIAYVPKVISGTLALIVGMLIARLVGSIVYVTAKNTDMPIPEGLSLLSKVAIVVYSTYIFLTEVGFIGLLAGINYSHTIIALGIVLALALAFGLGGKDIAAKYLDIFHVKKANHH